MLSADVPLCVGDDEVQGSRRKSGNWCVSTRPVSGSSGWSWGGDGNDDEVGEVLREHLELARHESIIWCWSRRRSEWWHGWWLCLTPCAVLESPGCPQVRAHQVRVATGDCGVLAGDHRAGGSGEMILLCGVSVMMEFFSFTHYFIGSQIRTNKSKMNRKMELDINRAIFNLRITCSCQVSQLIWIWWHI